MSHSFCLGAVGVIAKTGTSRQSYSLITWLGLYWLPQKLCGATFLRHRQRAAVGSMGIPVAHSAPGKYPGSCCVTEICLHLQRKIFAAKTEAVRTLKLFLLRSTFPSLGLVVFPNPTALAPSLPSFSSQTPFPIAPLFCGQILRVANGTRCFEVRKTQRNVTEGHGFTPACVCPGSGGDAAALY